MILLLASLAYAADAPPPAAHGALLLQGFDAVWYHRPHRVKSFGVGVDATSPSADGTPSGTTWVQMEGGSWADGQHASDIPDVSLRYAGLSTSRPILRGEVSSRISGRASRDPVPTPAETTIDVDVPLPAGSGDGAAVWLTGFEVHTDEKHPDGFTVHGLTIEVGAPTVADGHARFPVHVVVQAAPVLDRRQRLVADYGASVAVDWALVPAPAYAVHRLDVSSRLRHGIALAEQADVVEAHPEAIGRVTSADPNGVVSALSGFHLDLDEEGAVSGRYLRAMTVEIEDERYDPFRREYDADVALRFTNSGQVSRPIKVSASATVTVLELAPGDHAWTGRWTPELERPSRAEAAYP